MHVTAEVKARVVAKLQEGIAIAEKHYGIKIAMPLIKYAKRGTTAGTANYRTWTVDFNAVLLMQNVEDFIARTVPHELAHLINDHVYPESHESAGTTVVRRGGRLIRKRLPRDVHGTTWQSVMRVLGVKDITRCHSYDTSDAKVVKSSSRQIKWVCSKCKAELMLTPAKSARLDASPDSVWHRGCRGARLVRAEAVQVDLTKYGAVASPVLPTPIITLPPKPVNAGSKIDACKQIYLKATGLSRSDMIARFVSQAGCTPAGASTYYQSLKTRLG